MAQEEAAVKVVGIATAGSGEIAALEASLEEDKPATKCSMPPTDLPHDYDPRELYCANDVTTEEAATASTAEQPDTESADVTEEGEDEEKVQALLRLQELSVITEMTNAMKILGMGFFWP